MTSPFSGPSTPPAHVRTARQTVRLGPQASAWSRLRRLPEWFRSGPGNVSDRQWRDIIAILRINRTSLDDQYLKATAALVDLSELLYRAQQEVVH